MAKMMTARTAQYSLASVFFVLGGWCLIAPRMVMELAFTPAYQSSAPVVPILIAGFGAQAVLAGIFAAFSNFTRRTFLAGSRVGRQRPFLERGDRPDCRQGKPAGGDQLPRGR